MVDWIIPKFPFVLSIVTLTTQTFHPKTNFKWPQTIEHSKLGFYDSDGLGQVSLCFEDSK